MLTDVVRDAFPLCVNNCSSFGAQKVENEVERSSPVAVNTCGRPWPLSLCHSHRWELGERCGVLIPFMDQSLSCLGQGQRGTLITATGPGSGVVIKKEHIYIAFNLLNWLHY